MVDTCTFAVPDNTPAGIVRFTCNTPATSVGASRYATDAGMPLTVAETPANVSGSGRLLAA